MAIRESATSPVPEPVPETGLSEKFSLTSPTTDVPVITPSLKVTSCSPASNCPVAGSTQPTCEVAIVASIPLRLTSAKLISPIAREKLISVAVRFAELIVSLETWSAPGLISRVASTAPERSLLSSSSMPKAERVTLRTLAAGSSDSERDVVIRI